ncbi:hypothetical protein DLAC_08988 [Tieghemostelium lacteum]|uniref:MRH domain-containing protein n=1 Tax=Tieghemostelium lacteum TaxID=361077 RepID=A0A151Z8T8_TIELA|nr:hypothetical protein DLAC_08988 [Tieghemostelium lacteum]|eukprot:KYQ90370.1 hypothetical protein DLAC_08988 [Tieghemostelium lacteum]
MSIKSIILIISVIMISSIQCQTSLSNCTFIADGYQYDFSSFGSYNPNGYFWNFGYDQGQINVCQTAYGCVSYDGSTGMAGCKYFEQLGQVQSGEFSSMSPAGTGAYLTYFDNSYMNYIIRIKLLCVPNKTIPSIISSGISSTNSRQYEFTISGKGACGYQM